MSTQLFDQLIGETPPSTVDVAGIVRREKRRSATRRLTGLTTTMAAVAVTAAVGLSMTGGTGASSPPSVAGAASPAASTPPDIRFALVMQNEASAAATAKRLETALDQAVREEAPGAKWIFEPNIPGETGADGRPLKLSYKVARGAKKDQTLFAGDSGILNDGRKGNLNMIVVGADSIDEDGSVRRHTVTCPPPDQSIKCTAETAPNGAKAVARTDEFDGFVMYSYEVALPDGRALAVTNSNDFGPDGSDPAQPGTPLTSDQVKAIALAVAGQIKA